MFEGFETRDIETSGARIHLRHGGKGPPLLLLHGNPLTHVAWHKIANRLARHFHVVASDLGGYGDSSAPETDAEHTPYTFRAMAQDQVEIMAALGYTQFMVAGHDRGARTAHRMAIDHRDRVLKAAFVDILPNWHIWNNVSKQWALNSWHWSFMAQPAPFSEQMMGAVDPRWYMEKKLSKPGIGLAHCEGAAFDEYVRCFTPKTIHGSCEDYRACPTSDLAMDIEDKEKGVTCDMPVLVVWGTKSHTGRLYGDVLSIWREWCPNATGGPIDCGHYVQEEAPDDTFDWFMKFFANS